MNLRRSVCVNVPGNAESIIDHVKREAAKDGRTGEVTELKLQLPRTTHMTYMYLIEFDEVEMSTEFITAYSTAVVNGQIWYLSRMSPRIIPESMIVTRVINSF
jgi:hypothetical protein